MQFEKPSVILRESVVRVIPASGSGKEQGAFFFVLLSRVPGLEAWRGDQEVFP